MKDCRISSRKKGGDIAKPRAATIISATTMTVKKKKKVGVGGVKKANDKNSNNRGDGGGGKKKSGDYGGSGDELNKKKQAPVPPPPSRRPNIAERITMLQMAQLRHTKWDDAVITTTIDDASAVAVTGSGSHGDGRGLPPDGAIKLVLPPLPVSHPMPRGETLPIQTEASSKGAKSFGKGGSFVHRLFAFLRGNKKKKKNKNRGDDDDGRIEPDMVVIVRRLDVSEW